MLRPLFLAFTIAASPATACRLPDGAEALARNALAAINGERQAKNLAPLRQDPRLQQAAQSHACDSATRNRMGHDSSDGSDLGQRATRAGYDYREIAENVAQGYPSPASVTQGWMESPGHRRNILMRKAKDAGLGIAVGRNGDLHWVLNLGRE